MLHDKFSQSLEAARGIVVSIFVYLVYQAVPRTGFERLLKGAMRPQDESVLGISYSRIKAVDRVDWRPKLNACFHAVGLGSQTSALSRNQRTNTALQRCTVAPTLHENTTERGDREMRPGFGGKCARKLVWRKQQKMSDHRVAHIFRVARAFTPKPHAHCPVAVRGSSC